MGFEKIDVPSGNVVFYEGQEGDAAYLIKFGHIEIRKGEDHDAVALASLGSGDIFGEMALFDERPRMATAVAKDDTQLIRISRESFEERLGPVDPVMRTIIKYMVGRVRQMTDEFIEQKRGRLHWRKKE